MHGPALMALRIGGLRQARGALPGLVLCAASLVAAPAQAQVIEVGPEGVVTRSGPAITTQAGVSPIAPPAKPASLAPAQAQKLAEAAPLLSRAGEAAALSPRLLEAVAYVESRFNHKAVSPKGAIGLMQLTPGTAAELGVDPHNPETNARGGAAYLRQMLAMFDNNVELALAAYNAGPQAVMRYKGVPPYPETRAYVAAVLDYMSRSVPEAK